MSAGLMCGHCLRHRSYIKQHMSAGREAHRKCARQNPPQMFAREFGLAGHEIREFRASVTTHFAAGQPSINLRVYIRLTKIYKNIQIVSMHGTLTS